MNLSATNSTFGLEQNMINARIAHHLDKLTKFKLYEFSFVVFKSSHLTKISCSSESNFKQIALLKYGFKGMGAICYEFKF